MKTLIFQNNIKTKNIAHSLLRISGPFSPRVGQMFITCAQLLPRALALQRHTDSVRNPGPMFTPR